MTQGDTTCRLAIGPETSDAEVVAAVDAWIEAAVPEPWRHRGAATAVPAAHGGQHRALAAVVGAPDDRLGEVPVAFVAGETDSDLESVCRRHLVPYKVPVRFEWVDRLPRSETGKVLRRELATDREALRASSRQTRDFALRMTAWHCGVTKPVVAAVNGTCAGGGLHFVADADIVIAADNATFLDPHVSAGQVSAFESIGLLKKAPMESVARIVLTGAHERLSAERARQLGVVSEVVAADGLRDRARQLAADMAEQDPVRLRAMKRALWNALEAP